MSCIQILQGVAKKTVPLPNCPYLNRKLISRLDFLNLESLYDLLLESKSLSRFSRSSAFFVSCFDIWGKIKVNNDFDIWRHVIKSIWLKLSSRCIKRTPRQKWDFECFSKFSLCTFRSFLWNLKILIFCWATTRQSWHLYALFSWEPPEISAKN